MNILSLFDGLGGLRTALRDMDVEVANYYASEVDKFAIRQTKYMFPGVKHLGSVVDLDTSIFMVDRRAIETTTNDDAKTNTKETIEPAGKVKIDLLTGGFS